MKKPRVVVNGALGKMGRVAVAALTESGEFELAACLGHQDNLAHTLATTPVDIVVDLTRADSVFANSVAIVQAGCRPVIGTSGLTSEQISQLQAECAAQGLGGLIVPNFSLAAVLMMQVIIDTHPDWFATAAERADLRLLALCAILGVTSWTGLCRLLRGETLKLRELEYIQAAQAFGVSDLRIIARHILPNLMHIVIIALVMLSELISGAVRKVFL